MHLPSLKEDTHAHIRGIHPLKYMQESVLNPHWEH